MNHPTDANTGRTPKNPMDWGSSGISLIGDQAIVFIMDTLMNPIQQPGNLQQGGAAGFMTKFSTAFKNNKCTIKQSCRPLSTHFYRQLRPQPPDMACDFLRFTLRLASKYVLDGPL